MTDATKQPQQPRARGTHGRSPGYPFISLEKAVTRARELKEAEGFYAVPIASAYKAWGISEKSSTSPLVVAALKHFGLLEYAGSGAARQCKLTDRAKRILQDVRPDSKDRAQLIRDAALTPAAHQDVLKKYPNGLPSDATLQTYLVLDRGFNETGAKSLIAELRDTLAFAKVDLSGNIPMPAASVDGEEDPPQKIEVGDLVQVEIGGVFQLKEPRRVRAVKEHEGSDWVFIEGSETGFPMDQIVLHQATDAARNAASNLKKPPVLPLDGEGDASNDSGWQQERLIDDGGEEILIRYKGEASINRYEFIRDYLDFKIKRLKAQ
jgi:hypothetical protein